MYQNQLTNPPNISGNKNNISSNVLICYPQNCLRVEQVFFLNTCPPRPWQIHKKMVHLPIHDMAGLYIRMFPKRVPPKSSILIGFSIIFTIHFGGFYPYFLETPIYIYNTFNGFNGPIHGNPSGSIPSIGTFFWAPKIDRKSQKILSWVVGISREYLI